MTSQPPSDEKTARSRQRRSGRTRRSSTQSAPVIEQAEFQDILNPMQPLQPLSEDQLEGIHNASLTILSEMGIEVNSPKARAAYREAGADVDDTTEIVRFPHGLVTSLISTAPSSFILTPTNEQRKLLIGGNQIHFGMVSGAPNVH